MSVMAILLAYMSVDSTIIDLPEGTIELGAIAVCIGRKLCRVGRCLMGESTNGSAKSLKTSL